MFKYGVLVLGVALLGGCVSAQTTLNREPMIERLAGNQEAVASCIYLGLEKDYSDGLRMVELKGAGTTRIYNEIGVAQNTRMFDLALVQEQPETVRVEIRGLPTVFGGQYWENRILPIVQSCARS